MAEELGGLSATIHVEVDKNDVEKARKDINSIFGNTNDKGFIDSMSEQMAKANEKQVKSVKQWKQSVETATAEVEEKHVKTSKKIADTSEKTAKKVSKNVKESADLTKKEIDAIDNALKKVAGAIGGYFAINALRGYLGQVVAIRSQFASTEKSFNVLLGSEEKGKKLFEDIKEFGATTPMNLGELASSAKMMLGFGIKLKDIMPNLRALGDVAMGDSGKFMSLSLAFSQASATGKLMGQDLLQMVNAGFNPLETMAKTTGKTIKQLKEEMSAGKISADMLRKAFMDATSEGGKYAGMLNEQSKTIAGARSNLEDSFDQMFNSIGEMIEDKYIDVIHFIESLVQNYKEVAKVLAELTVAYGVYRVALWTVTAYQKASIIATRMQSIATLKYGENVKKVTALQVMFGKAQKAAGEGIGSITKMINPYTLLAAAIAASAYAVYKLCTQKSDIDKLKESFDGLKDSYNENLSKENVEINTLFGRLKAVTEGTKEYANARQKIIDKYGQYLTNQSKEIQNLTDIEGAYKAIKKAMREKFKEETLQKARQEFVETTGKKAGNIRGQVFDYIDRKWKGNDAANAQMREKQKVQAERYLNAMEDGSFNGDLLEQYNFSNWIEQFANETTMYDPKLGYNMVTRTNAIKDEFSNFNNIMIEARKEMARQERLWQNSYNEMFAPPEKEDEKTDTKTDEDDGLKKKKEQYNRLKKYAEDYAKIMIERNNTIADLETDFNKTEQQKADERVLIEKQTLDKLSKLNSTTTNITAEQREKIVQGFTDLAKMTAAQADELLPKVYQKITEYDEGVAKSKGKTKNKAAEIKVNFAQAESDIPTLILQRAIAENIQNRSYKNTDYSPLAEKYVDFVNKFQEQVTRRTENELKPLILSLENPELTPEQKAKIQKEIQWTTNEITLAQQKLVQEYGNGNLELIDLITETITESEGKTQEVLNAEILSLENQVKTFGKVDSKERAKELADLKTKAIALNVALEVLKKTMFTDKKNTFWKDFLANLDKVKSATDELFNQMLKFDELVDGTGQNTIKQLQAVFTSTISLIEGIKKFSDITAKGIIKSGEAVKSALNLIETASTILMIINAVMQAVQALDNLFSKKDVTAEFIDGMQQANLELKEFRRELQKIKEMDVYTSIFGNDQWGTLTTNINNANKAYGRLIANIADFNNQRFEKNNGGKSHVFGSHSGSAGYKMEDEFAETFGFNPERMEKELENFSKNIAKVQVKTGTKGWWLWKSDVTEDLSKVAPELFDKQGKINMDMVDKFVEQNSNAYQALTETQKTALKEMSDNWKEYNEYLQTVKDTMSQWFGGLTNNIADMWVNAFKTGEYQLQDFKEIWDTTIEQMTTSMMTSQLITPILDNAEKKLEDIGYYQNPQAHLDEFFNVMSTAYKDIDGIKDDAMNMLQKWHDDYGLYQTDAEKDKIRSALDGGGIQSITQDTAEELNGRITQIQSHTYNISECSTAMREMQQQQLVLLQGIKGDTTRLANIETEITKMRSAIVDINDRGVRMR